MYLVDTNIVSEARRGTAEAVAWVRSVDPADINLSVITIGEIMSGIALKEKTDPLAADKLRQWLQRLRRDHAARILPITDRVAIEWGRIEALRPRGDADGLIAATAIVHGLTVVTRNTDDFGDMGVPVINPWTLGPRIVSP